MSIWASWLVLDDSEDDGLGAPYQYIASHVFPRLDHRHPSAYVEVAAIPGFIGDEAAGVEPICGENDNLVHPWLRLSCAGDDAVLDREMVELLRDVLTQWLQRT